MSEPDKEQIQEIRKRIGTVLLWMGGAMSLLMFIDHSELNVVVMPAFWYRSRSLHLLVCIGFFLGGMFLLRNQAQAADVEDGSLHRTGEWHPLFDRVRFYSRADCPLCDEAMDRLEEYSEWMPEIEFVDIAGDQRLEEQYGEWIPVIEIDGQIRFRGRVDTLLLQRLIAAPRRGQSALKEEQSP